MHLSYFILVPLRKSSLNYASLNYTGLVRCEICIQIRPPHFTTRNNQLKKSAAGT